MESFPIVWTSLIELQKAGINNIPDNLSGAYRLSYKHENNNIYVFYVGQSPDIKSQLESFISNNLNDVCIKNFISSKKCFFRYSKIDQEDIRKATVRAMYKRYIPTCNDKLPEGREDIIINLS